MKKFILLILLSLICTCSKKENQSILKLATTTSVDNTGLLKELIHSFEKKYNIKVAVIAVGTGKAIKLAENGDVNVIFVHDPDSEEKFVNDGYGVNRTMVMHNDFVIAGSPDDPAKIKGEKDAINAFRKITESKVPFVSRGDNSGTHMKEKAIWKLTGINPEGEWYISCGQGMETALMIAFEKKAYILTDRGTYNAMKDKINLIILSEGDERLINTYSIIAVNPAKHPNAKYKEVMNFIEWMTSTEAQNIIGNFKKHGEALFIPDAIK